jgi:tyrosyl-tRNA synthetase
MSGALEELEKRGFLQQCSDLDGLRKTMEKEQVSFYVGVDPTARSLHIGHMVPFYALAHLQHHGHRPIVVVGGGTGMIGDPSGKTEMRKILSIEEIRKNEVAIKEGASKLIDFSDGRAIMVNNYEWLGNLNYIEFLRDIGVHFSVNRMLSFEAYKQRLEKGLSFIEFNYMLLQSYDFLILNRKYGCKVQVGGDDQWGNILSGVELIRRMDGNEAYALTFPLVTRADGKKMGKSEKGAIFLNPELCSPYEFFQYWRNVNDADVLRFLKMFTFLPLEEIEEMAHLEGQELNRAKERLAYEQTLLIHGEEEAKNALEASRAAFSAEGAAENRDALPGIEMPAADLEAGVNVLDLFAMTSLCSSRSEARRLVSQGGARVNDRKIDDIETMIDASYAEEGELLLRAGKKRYFRVRIKG